MYVCTTFFNIKNPIYIGVLIGGDARTLYLTFNTKCTPESVYSFELLTLKPMQVIGVVHLTKLAPTPNHKIVLTSGLTTYS